VCSTPTKFDIVLHFVVDRSGFREARESIAFFEATPPGGGEKFAGSAGAILQLHAAKPFPSAASQI
jgi:hypothetical protein